MAVFFGWAFLVWAVLHAATTLAQMFGLEKYKTPWPEWELIGRIFVSALLFAVAHRLIG